uniref:Galactosylgalactosylxylosylprotein 3-beta-glucuronosyltransferase n=1 Tax=Dracunculus medinensis TaxID=318479 RepID=A0A0N4UEU9_DRAME
MKINRALNKKNAEENLDEKHYLLKPNWKHLNENAIIYKLKYGKDIHRMEKYLSKINNLIRDRLPMTKSRNNLPVIYSSISPTYYRKNHRFMLTPANKKLNEADPNWKLPRGVLQRNAALSWLRTLETRCLYFGDDDNAYDLRLFE